MVNPAIVFKGKNEIEICDEAMPELNPGQVLVEASKTLISSGTEMICLQRNFGPGTHWDNWVKYPFYPGYSFAGRVVEAGAGVTTLKVGDRIALRSSHRRFHVTDASSALLIPDGVADADATWFGLATITQNGVRQARHEMGETVVIVGLGLLGQLVNQYVRLMGAAEVIAIDVSERRLEMAASHGATRTLQMSVDDARSAVEEITGGRMADVVYDVTGHPAVFSGALRLARKFGTVLLLGDAGTPSEQRLTSDVITRGLRIIGTHDGHPPAISTDENYWTKPNMARLFFSYLERGQMKVSDLATHVFSPLDAEKAYGVLAHDRMNAMGVIFDWTAPLPPADQTYKYRNE